MVIRDPSRGPTSRSRRCDRALGHRSQNRPRPDHIENPDSPPIVAASLKDTCRTCQRRRAQSDPPQMSHFAARRCDRPLVRSHACGGRSGHIHPSGKGAKPRSESRSIIPLMDHNTLAASSLDPSPSASPTTPAPSSPARRLVAASVSPNTRDSYTRRPPSVRRVARPASAGRCHPCRVLGRPLRRGPARCPCLVWRPRSRDGGRIDWTTGTGVPSTSTTHQNCPLSSWPRASPCSPNRDRHRPPPLWGCSTPPPPPPPGVAGWPGMAPRTLLEGVLAGLTSRQGIFAGRMSALSRSGRAESPAGPSVLT